MLPEKRSALFGVTAVAGLVQIVPNELEFCQGTMGIVTGGAGHFADANRMHRKLVGFGTLLAVALETDLRLCLDLEDRVSRRVDRMAIRTGNLARFMRAAMPPDTELLLVTVGADFVLFGNRRFLAAPERPHVGTFLAPADSPRVCAARSVATFALELSERCSLI